MSLKDDSPPSRDSYRRDNWWGEDGNGNASESEGEQHDGHGTDWSDEQITDDRSRHVTQLVLSGIAPKLCGVSLDDPAKDPVELSDPCAYPHGEGNRTHMRQARVNSEHGYISGGESTGVRLGNVDRDTFYDVVEILLGYWDTCGYRFDTEQLMVDAKRMKQNSDMRDAEIIETLAKDVLETAA